MDEPIELNSVSLYELFCELGEELEDIFPSTELFWEISRDCKRASYHFGVHDENTFLIFYDDNHGIFTVRFNFYQAPKVIVDEIPLIYHTIVDFLRGYELNSLVRLFEVSTKKKFSIPPLVEKDIPYHSVGDGGNVVLSLLRSIPAPFRSENSWQKHSYRLKLEPFRKRIDVFKDDELLFSIEKPEDIERYISEANVQAKELLEAEKEIVNFAKTLDPTCTFDEESGVLFFLSQKLTMSFKRNSDSKKPLYGARLTTPSDRKKASMGAGFYKNQTLDGLKKTLRKKLERIAEEEKTKPILAVI